MGKVAWRDCTQTNDLNDAEKSKFYSVRSHVVRAIQKQHLIASEKNAKMKYLNNPTLVKKIELSTSDIDKLARKAFDTGMMPILNEDSVVLTDAPVVGDMPC